MSPIVSLASLQQFAAVNLTLDQGAIRGPVHIPLCAAIGFQWTLASGKIAHNVLYGRFSGSFAGTVAQCNGIMTALTTGPNWTALAAQLAPTAAFSAVTIRNVDVINQPLLQSTNVAVPGTGTGTEMPDEVAAVITLRTAMVGPQNRGRVFVPGFATNAIGASNTIAAAAVTALTNWGGIIQGALSAQGYVWVLGQKERAAYTSIKTGRVFPPRPATSAAITNATVRDNHWDTIRRRGLK
jgi:hypothetical protein